MAKIGVSTGMVWFYGNTMNDKIILLRNTFKDSLPCLEIALPGDEILKDFVDNVTPDNMDWIRNIPFVSLHPVRIKDYMRLGYIFDKLQAKHITIHSDDDDMINRQAEMFDSKNISIENVNGGIDTLIFMRTLLSYKLINAKATIDIAHVALWSIEQALLLFCLGFYYGTNNKISSYHLSMKFHSPLLTDKAWGDQRIIKKHLTNQSQPMFIESNIAQLLDNKNDEINISSIINQEVTEWTNLLQ